MWNLKTRMWCLLALLGTLTISAQNQLGLRQGAYSGISSASLNPANTAAFPLAFDVNIAGISFFAENNYAYAESTNLFGFIKNANNLTLKNPEDPAHNNGDVKTFDFYRTSQGNYFASISARVEGPAAMIKIKEQTVGFFINGRSQWDVSKVDNQLGYDAYNFLEANSSFSVKDPEIRGMNWTEIGGHYSKNINKNISIGGNLKFLQGLDAATFNANKDIALLKQVNRLQVSATDVALATATNCNFETSKYNIKPNGFGAGADLGVRIAIGGTPTKEPILKVGLSLMDLGFVRMKKTVNTTAFSELKATFSNSSFEDVSTDAELGNTLSEIVTGDRLAAAADKPITMGTPAAASAQMNLNLSPTFSLNAVIVQRIPTTKNALKRANTFSVTPMYESRWLAVSAPITLHEYNDLRLGTAVRLGFLTIGTDNVASLIHQKDFSGSDVYIALKFNPFDWEKSPYTRSGKGSKSKVDCPKNFKWGKR